METLAEQYPEARGAGRYDESGGVVYGDESRPRVVVEPRNAREPGQPANIVASAASCPRCQHIPDAVISSLAAALAQGRPR